ncbi:hydrolase [Xylariomycetidae sp. FL2044]|nr:hydrolase [Xylariomycetidae sp. FL2044]
MCRQGLPSGEFEAPPQASAEPLTHNGPDTGLEPFPWDVGVFDAHCHPTDTMASIASISRMKARALTVMATRSQDQELVSEVASRQGVQDNHELLSSDLPVETRVIPSFGWHPWFSYQLYNDLASDVAYDGTAPSKVAHYDRVLGPSPSSKDVSFSSRLPDPRPLSEFLNETRKRLEKYPLALIGEVGLDKAFRLPESWTSDHEAQRDDGLTPGGREGRRLSPHRVQMAHQASVLQAQLRLAGEMGRAVSCHGVQAHGILYETIAECWKGHEKEVLSRREKRRVAEGAEDFSASSEDEDASDLASTPGTAGKPRKSKTPCPKPYPPRLCLHSFSGHVQILKQYTNPAVPTKVFFSFSTAINWGTGSEKTEEAVRAVPDDRILVESDLHTAGDEMDQSLEDVSRIICHIKGWALREGVERLARNWREFAFG